LLDADNIEVADVWSVEPEELDEIRERFYAYRDEILKLTML
jgi:DNA polymerase IIIc chi subunit